MSNWQQALSEMITSPEELLSLLEISPDEIAWQWDKKFPVRVSRSFVARMKVKDPNDPLLRQVLSLQTESRTSSKYSQDPLQEKSFNPVPGLLHKYPSRVLLTFSSSCGIHCRYCFRRHFPYAENNPGRQGWRDSLNYIQDHPEIIEVILSGGDPLMAQDKNIAEFLQALSAIEHIQLLRIHSRLPVVIPERINSDFIKIFNKVRFHTTIIYHINHPAEIIAEIALGVSALKQNNITVLNQSVLLKEVNDNIECLKTLSLDLFKAGILPY
ncbi:MAG: KamA family radical SAM protein, partial [Candidatus Berkiellales bacterium]